MRPISVRQIVRIARSWFPQKQTAGTPSIEYRDELLLNPSVERRIIEARRHWAALLNALILTTGIVSWAVFLSRQVSSVTGDHWLVQSWLWYIGAGALMCLAWEMLDWWTTVFIVTDKRFMIITGVITKKSLSMSITKLTDMSFSRPLVGQLLGYGTFQLESAGKKQALKTMKYLPRPLEFFLAVTELIYGDKKQPREVTGQVSDGVAS